MEQLNQVAEITVTYKPILSFRPIITTSKAAFIEIKPFYNEDLIGLQEQFVVMYLNRANKVLGAYMLSKGGITGTVADARLILGIALKIAACGIILSHNHPSGNLKPSQADIDLTLKVKEAAAFMDIKIIDHLIISPSYEYFSLAEGGLL